MRKSILALVWIGIVVSTEAAEVEDCRVTTWCRIADWTAGTIDGTSVGNHDDDQFGQLVWSYGYVTGGTGLGGASPWHQMPATPLLWASDWFGLGNGLWAAGNDVPPDVFNGGMEHGAQGSSYPRTPIVRWLNPLVTTAQVRVSGELELFWRGVNGFASPIDIDVVVAVERAAGWETIFSGRYPKPTSDSTEERLVLPVDVSTSLAPGDDLVWSMRVTSPAALADARFLMFDVIDITPIPEVLSPDLNCDGCTDLSDLATVLAAFGCQGLCAGDVDFDGDTDLADLAKVLASFGHGC